MGCLFPGVGLRAAQCLWAAGAAHLGEGIWRRGMLRPVPRWAAGGQGGRCPVRKPAPASRFGWRAWPRRAEGPLSQLLGVAPRVWRRGRPILGRGCGCSPATAMRLCRLTGADPRSGVRGQRRAVVQPPRRSYPQALLGRGELWVRTLDDSLTTPAVRV